MNIRSLATALRIVFLLILLTPLPCQAYFNVLDESIKCDAMVKEISMKQLLQQAANGDAAKEYCVGHSYQWGKDVSKSTKEAAKWYERAANHGYPAAGADLGQLYETGDGVPQDGRQAVKWYRVAAKLGSVLGQAYLGEMLLTGSIYGIEENHAEAAKWLHEALNGGYWISGLSLGWQYQNGDGVPKNLVVGHALTLFSDSMSDTLLYQNRVASTFSAKKLSSDQIIQAEILVQKMKSSGTRDALQEYFVQHVDEYCNQTEVSDKTKARYYAFGRLCDKQQVAH